MDFELTLPPTAEAISPLMITAPASHSGTALLQRAINGSSNGLCYGDNLFEEVLSIFEWATTLIEQHRPRREMEDTAIQTILKGETGLWKPDAAPEFTQHMSAIFSVIYNIPHLADSFAKEQGRDTWGMIRAALPAPVLGDLLSVFPNGKAVFVYRHPIEIARDQLRDAPDIPLASICDAWNICMNGYLKFSNDRLLKLRYEDAVDDPAALLDKVASFASLEDMALGAFPAGSEAETESGRALSDAERETILSSCEDMLAVYYPDFGS